MTSVHHIDLTDEPDETDTNQQISTPNARSSNRLDFDLTNESPSQLSTAPSLDSLTQSNNVDNSSKKAHQCNLCEMSFPTKSKLERHSVTHTQDKPFECHLCNRKFTQASNVSRHQRLGKCHVINAAHKMVHSYEWTPQLLLASQSRNQSSRTNSKRSHRRGYYPINKYLQK